MKPLEHIVKKIDDTISELLAATNAPEERHPLFQLSYNLGRLAEDTGYGRKVYDAVREHVDNAAWENVRHAVAAILQQHHAETEIPLPHQDLKSKVDALTKEALDAGYSSVVVLAKYENTGDAHFSTKLSLEEIPELRLTDDHIILDVIREISESWSELAHKD